MISCTRAASNFLQSVSPVRQTRSSGRVSLVGCDAAILMLSALPPNEFRATQCGMDLRALHLYMGSSDRTVESIVTIHGNAD